jgi:predicted metalloendopeptidase
VTSHEALAKLMTDMTHDGFVVPYAIGAMVDNDDATKYIMGVSQNGLGLQPKFYDDNSSTAVKKREHYLSYMRETLTLAKFEDVNKTVSEAMSVETLLAKSSYTVVQMQDIQLTHNSSDFTKLCQMLSHFDISGLFDKMGYPKDRKININTPKYLEALNQLFVDIPVERWKQYLKAKVVLTYSGILGEDFIQAAQHYSIKEGLATKLEPLDVRAIRGTSSSLGYLFGKVYIERYFTDTIKAKVQKILESIIAEYKIAITDTTRFGDKTKKAALLKIEKMTFNIAYPTKWHDYSSYKTKKDDLFFNTKELIKYGQRKEIQKLKKGIVDKEEWDGLPPQEINAFYNPLSNKFILLAGILHAPIFDINNSDAANYGGIGMVIGHEIGHAFDKTGAQFDENGNMNNWWTKDDLKRFDKLNDTLIAQANNYEVVPGVHANGKLEVGEIQADLSGIEISLRAYLRTLGGDEATQMAGMRDFFVQFAKTWKSKSKPKLLEMLNDADGHPVAEYRINGTLKNLDAFYKAYDIKKGDAMYRAPEDRVKIW